MAAFFSDFTVCRQEWSCNRLATLHEAEAILLFSTVQSFQCPMWRTVWWNLGTLEWSFDKWLVMRYGEIVKTWCSCPDILHWIFSELFRDSLLCHPSILKGFWKSAIFRFSSVSKIYKDRVNSACIQSGLNFKATSKHRVPNPGIFFVFHRFFDTAQW